MRGDAVTLSDLVGKITMLEVACRRCERRGRLRLSRLIEQHGDMRLILPRDCPKAEAPSVGERCSIYFRSCFLKIPPTNSAPAGKGAHERLAGGASRNCSLSAGLPLRR